LNVFPPESISTFSPGQFDCITLWHVLEHLYNPESYFSGIRRILKPGGTVIVALPNSDSFDAKYFGKLWAAWDVPRHLWHFNPKVFRQFASKAGFDVRSEYVLPFDVFYISVLSERATKRKGGMLKGMILGKFFWLKTLFMTKRASSVVYILKLVSDQ
jgi:2-polyprenyl-3-methyl-5-hydroxy-6-metoxy-1,4-benzoquinol methylase